MKSSLSTHANSLLRLLKNECPAKEVLVFGETFSPAFIDKIQHDPFIQDAFKQLLEHHSLKDIIYYEQSILTLSTFSYGVLNLNIYRDEEQVWLPLLLHYLNPENEAVFKQKFVSENYPINVKELGEMGNNVFAAELLKLIPVTDGLRENMDSTYLFDSVNNPIFLSALLESSAFFGQKRAKNIIHYHFEKLLSSYHEIENSQDYELHDSFKKNLLTNIKESIFCLLSYSFDNLTDRGFCVDLLKQPNAFWLLPLSKTAPLFQDYISQFTANNFTSLVNFFEQKRMPYSFGTSTPDDIQEKIEFIKDQTLIHGIQDIDLSSLDRIETLIHSPTHSSFDSLLETISYSFKSDAAFKLIQLTGEEAYASFVHLVRETQSPATFMYAKQIFEHGVEHYNQLKAEQKDQFDSLICMVACYNAPLLEKHAVFLNDWVAQAPSSTRQSFQKALLVSLLHKSGEPFVEGLDNQERNSIRDNFLRFGTQSMWNLDCHYRPNSFNVLLSLLDKSKEHRHLHDFILTCFDKNEVFKDINGREHLLSYNYLLEKALNSILLPAHTVTNPPPSLNNPRF